MYIASYNGYRTIIEIIFNWYKGSAENEKTYLVHETLVFLFSHYQHAYM